MENVFLRAMQGLDNPHSCQRLHFCAILRRKRGQHLGHAAAKDRMAPIRGDIGQRNQNKSAILKPRMRQDQFLRGKPCLITGRQIAPTRLRRCIGQDQPIYRQKIKVKRAHAPARVALAAKARLDRMKMRKKPLWRCLGPKFDHGGGIHIIGTRALWKTGRLEWATCDLKFEGVSGKTVQGLRDGLFRGLTGPRKIGAQRNQSEIKVLHGEEYTFV